MENQLELFPQKQTKELLTTELSFDPPTETRHEAVTEKKPKLKHFVIFCHNCNTDLREQNLNGHLWHNVKLYQHDPRNNDFQPPVELAFDQVT